MHWLFLLMALGALVLAFSTPHVWLLVASLLVALLLLLLWTRGWFASRMGDATRYQQHDRPGRAAPPARAGRSTQVGCPGRRTRQRAAGLIAA